MSGTEGPSAGDLIADRYRLERWLGAGGMGTVWSATNLFTRRAVALKFLLSARHSEPGARARLLREARAACRVRHPNVVAVHDLLEVDGAPVLVMDLLEGETLGERLRREGRLEPALVVHVAREILGALESAHASGIVHRDLKPDNVFLTGNARRPEIKLLDFGIAKLTRQDDIRGLSTETGTLVGTPHYMAPEQAFGEQRIDGRADLWALGVVMYECLAGRRPLDGANVGQVLRKLAHAEIPPLDPDVPEPLSRLIGRLLCDRDRRIASAAEAARMLAETSGSGPALARTDTPEPHSVQARPRGERRARWFGAAALVAVLALSVIPWRSSGDERPPTLRRALAHRVLFPPRPRTPVPQPAEKPPAPTPSVPARKAVPARKRPEPKPPAVAPSSGADKLIAEPRF